jgi:HEAT repeat protein
VPSTEFLTWRGWKYLNGASSAPARIYAGPGNWGELAGAKSDADAVTLRVKFVIFRSVERMGQDRNGLLRADRETIEDNQFAEVQNAIQRLALHVASVSGGKARLVPEIAIETETMRGTRDPQTAIPALSNDRFGEAFVRGYLRPRINGGGYEAEDKVFRGPYHSVICLFPAIVQRPESTQVYGMPVHVLSIESPDKLYASGDLDTRLRAALASGAVLRAQRHGYAAPTGSETTDWKEVANLGEETGADMATHVGKPAPVGPELGAPIASVPTWRSASAEPSLVTDVDKSQVVKFLLKGPTRAVAVAFPNRGDGQPLTKLADNRTLNITLRTLAKDPLAIRLEGKDGKRAWVTLQPETPVGEPLENAQTAAIKADGTWETLAIDIAPVAQKAGIDEITALALEFTPHARRTMRTLSEAMEVFIDDVHFSNDPQSGVQTATDEVATKATFAKQATAASPELLALLSERHPVIRLNAADAYTRIKDPAAEDALTTIAIGMDGSAGERALSALAFQGTDTAKASIRRMVRTALLGYSRGIAAMRLAELNDPKTVGDLSSLLAHREWQTRLAGVQSLAKLTNREAGIVRLAFLAQENPEIKLAVTEAIDANDEPQVRRLLWSMVNEGPDLIRAASALKLIQSPLPALKSEGYKAVRDDSPTVRVLVLEGLAARPDEANREAIRLGLADRNPSVRAAALHAVAALEKGATDEELAPALEDAHPDVQMALIAYAEKRGVKLPSAAVERLRNSPFPRVQEAARKIGE